MSIIHDKERLDAIVHDVMGVLCKHEASPAEGVGVCIAVLNQAVNIVREYYDTNTLEIEFELLGRMEETIRLLLEGFSIKDAGNLQECTLCGSPAIPIPRSKVIMCGKCILGVDDVRRTRTRRNTNGTNFRQHD